MNNLNLNPKRSDFSAADSNDVAADQISAGQTAKNGGEASADTTFDTSLKWTRGPWVECESSRSGVEAVVRGRLAEMVAKVPLHKSNEGSANAELIAAAPEMYEALTTAAAWYRYCLEFMSWSQFPNLEREVRSKLAETNAALAKARGEN